MAKAKVLDDKVVIKSEVLTDENLRKVSILKPSALILTDEETKEGLYVVSAGNCNSFTKYGAIFAGGESKANIAVHTEDAEEKKDILKDVITSNLVKINAIEEQVETYLEDAEDIDTDIEFLN